MGQEITILATGSITITNGTPIKLSGAIDYDMVSGDTLTLTMYNDQVWVEDGRMTLTAILTSNLLDKSATETVSGAYTFTGGVTVSTGNIVAGTIDADFDAITGTSYGGITEANLVDKAATESITGGWSFPTEAVTTTNVITAGETGKTFYLNTAGGFTSTLPVPAAGLKYTFIVTTAPTTAYIITTDSGADLLFGTFLDIVGELVYFSAQDVLNFVASTSLVGDRLEVESDGTNWYCKAFSGADGGITTGQT